MVSVDRKKAPAEVLCSVAAKMTSEACDSDELAIVVRYLHNGKYSDGMGKGEKANLSHRNFKLEDSILYYRTSSGKQNEAANQRINQSLRQRINPSVQLEKTPSAAFPSIRRVCCFSVSRNSSCSHSLPSQKRKEKKNTF